MLCPWAVILSKFVPCRLPSYFMIYSWAPPGPQYCLYNLLEGQPENSWPLGKKYYVISNPSRYSDLHLPCFLQHVRQQPLSVDLLGWVTGTQCLLEVICWWYPRAVGLLGIMFATLGVALQAVWAQTITTLILKLQTYSQIKSPLHFCGTCGLLPLINLFLSHLLTPTTRTLPLVGNIVPPHLLLKYS